MQEAGTSITEGLASPVPPGFKVEDLADELRFIMTRYPSMRTRLRFDADGTTRQVVESEGEISFEVVDVHGEEDPAEVAAGIRERYKETLFDYEKEWPLRFALVCKDGVPSHVVRAFCHLASDAMGFARVVSEVLDPRRAELPAPDATDALDQAAWQRSAAGLRQSDNALRYWEELLRVVPARRFSSPVDEGSARGRWQIEFESPAMWLAMRAVADRLGASSAAVLLGAYVLALSRLADADPVVTRVLVSNRFRSNLSTTVSPITQAGLLAVGAKGASLDEVVARCQRATIAMYKHAYYDPQRLRELVARVSEERGEQIDLACLFNDRRRDENRPETGPVPTVAQIRAALPETKLRWAFPTPGLREKLLVSINNAAGTISISAMVDTEHVSPDNIEGLLHGMEQSVVVAAT